ncbi:type II toxin-antitoxin system RelE/ParE family toxin [soil metagenome]
MKLRYTPHASRQLGRIARYIRESSPAAARQVSRRIRNAAKLLSEFPDLGHTGTLDGTKELVVPGLPYVIVHRVEPHQPDVLTVLAIYHGAQLRPGQSRPTDDP